MVNELVAIGSSLLMAAPLEARIESRWVEAKSRTRGMDVHGDGRLSVSRRCWHSIRGLDFCMTVEGDGLVGPCANGVR